MSDRGLTETTESSESVYSGVLLKVVRDRVRLPDGKHAVREYIRHPGAVAIIAVEEDGRFLMERQFRYPVGRAFFEVPAGKIDTGEDILACARRELHEEAGCRAAEWHHLGCIHPCIGYSNERIEVFLARGLTRIGQKLDDGEFLQLLHMNGREIRAAIAAGRITDAKTLSALALLPERL